MALAFATLGLAFAELEVLDAFAWTLNVGAVVGEEVRGTLLSVVAVLGFAKLVLVVASSNRGFTEVATFGTLFPLGIFDCGYGAVAVVPDAFVVALASTRPFSEESWS